MNTINKKNRTLMAMLILMISQMSAFAQEAAPAAQPAATGSSDNMIRYVLGGVIVLFVFIIAVLSNALKVASQSFQEKIRAERSGAVKALVVTLFLSLAGNSVFAQEAAKASGSNFLDNWDIYILMGAVFLLFIVILVMVRTLFVLMGIKGMESAEASAYATGKGKVKTWFQRFNETVPIEDEDQLDMSHDYDGIRELDNKVPSWWNWAFMTFVVFSVIYLYRMFVAETLPNQFVELEQANQIAEVQKAAYLKKGANNVDENTVKMVSAAEIAEGATLYAKNCVACHGDKGQGGVGPNMTDDYWLHKGGIKDIFYSIKYGWQEKGMKSWKDELSPLEIAKISSFIVKMKGTNPPGAKEKQGELYIEEAAGGTATADSTKTPEVKDTTSKK